MVKEKSKLSKKISESLTCRTLAKRQSKTELIPGIPHQRRHRQLYIGQQHPSLLLGLQQGRNRPDTPRSICQDSR